MQTIEQRVEQVRGDREHGSRWLVREALLIVRDLALTPFASEEEHMRHLYRVGCELARARPAMAALTSAVSRVLFARADALAVAEAASDLLQEYDTATARIASYALPYLHGRLLTCSLSGTVLDVMTRAAIAEVIVLEGRPRYEGRDMARALGAQGIPVTLITDAQAAIFLPRCQGIVIGADSVLANGDVLNKSGSALLAWAGYGLRIPFYVLCESLKIASQGWPEQDEAGASLLEEKEPAEVLSTPLPGVTVRNFYFDRTPAHLVSKLITEQGILSLSAVQALSAMVQEQENFLMRQCM